MTVDDLTACIPNIAGVAHAVFHRYTDRDDIEQELHLYLLVEARRFEKWLADDGEHEALRALAGAARQFCEKEKAAQSGYEFDDVAWYSPSKLSDLLPTALNPGWDGLSGESDNEGHSSGSAREGGTLLAMVADIRRAVEIGRLPGNAGSYDPETESGMDMLVALSERLGGEYPTAPGYGRRAA